MSSLTKCARCGKKPTVRSNRERAAWMDVAESQTKCDAFPSSEFYKDDVDFIMFASSLRADGAHESHQDAQQRVKSDHKASADTLKPQLSLLARLTETSGYTGHGLGKEGRDCMAKGTGYPSPESSFSKSKGYRVDIPQPQRNTEATSPIAHPILNTDQKLEAEKLSLCPCGATAGWPGANFCSVCGRRLPAATQPVIPVPVLETGFHDDSEKELDEREVRIEDVFTSYCSGKPTMDGRSFTKLCKTSGLVDKSFSATDADLLFSKVVTKGQRRIGLDEFLHALMLLAKRKGVEAAVILRTVMRSGGPVFQATVTDAVRFHDDKSTYTGVHINGGPEPVRKGMGSASQLAAACMRTVKVS